MTIAALFVETNGAYFGLDNVDPWDVTRDARLYAGPHRVVAHPPCERWGRYWGGGPSARVKRIKGDDSGCFRHALNCVRTFGGVLEHPEASHAWAAFGLIRPPRSGGWVRADGEGWTCCVEQGHYGHRARKATWLYAVGVSLPKLKWGRAPGEFVRLDEGCHSTEERKRRHMARYEGAIERLSKTQRAATPLPFRDLLLSMARSTQRQVAA